MNDFIKHVVIVIMSNILETQCVVIIIKIKIKKLHVVTMLNILNFQPFRKKEIKIGGGCHGYGTHTGGQTSLITFKQFIAL